MRGRRLALAGLLALGLLGGCAVPRPVPDDPLTRTWTGRLALTVDGQPSQSFSAGFALQGRAEVGELTLYNPLGGTLAVLAWAPGSATLRTGDQARQFASVEALAQEATGAPLPIAALFDWLAGVDTRAAGWEADVSQLPQGRLRAQRSTPLPAADLRVAIDR